MISLRSRPDINVSPLAWENSWADEMEVFFALRNPPRTMEALMPNLPSNSDSSILQQDRHTREICDLQTDMTRALVESWIHDDFERRWKDATDQKRKEVILEGIVRVCKSVKWLERKRGFCPEVTLRKLSADKGESYLQLMRKVIPERLPSLTNVMIEPVYVPHPIIEHMFRLTDEESHKPQCTSVIRSYRLQRTYFLTMALWNIFLAFVSALCK